MMHRFGRRSATALALAVASVGAVLVASAPALAEDWNAVSNTAMSITGDISVSRHALIFQNGARLNLASKTRVRDFDASGESVDADVYEVADPADPDLENGNPLCGSGDVTYVVLWSPGDADRMMAVFTGDEMPDSDEGLCASYAYQVSN